MATDPNKILTKLRTDSYDYAAALSAIQAEKKTAQSVGDEIFANQLWATESIIQIHQNNAMVRQLQSLYPYRFFASYVMHVKAEKCSICGQNRSIRCFCGHRLGKVYNGELCCNIVTDAELKGIDIVENPVHKFSVLFPSDSEGRHDHYDYTLLEELMKVWSKPFQFWK